MIDKEKMEQAIELLKASRVKTCIMLTMDEEYHDILLNGTRRDLVELLANALDDVDIANLFALAVIARSVKGRRAKNADQE